MMFSSYYFQIGSTLLGILRQISSMAGFQAIRWHRKKFLSAYNTPPSIQGYAVNQVTLCVAWLGSRPFSAQSALIPVNLWRLSDT